MVTPCPTSSDSAINACQKRLSAVGLKGKETTTNANANDRHGGLARASVLVVIVEEDDEEDHIDCLHQTRIESGVGSGRTETSDMDDRKYSLSWPTRQKRRRRTLHTLITKRSMHLRSHPGECCFPGGRQDEEDEGCDIRTALREANEEIGLRSEDVTPLARLETLESIHHLCVTPIVGWFHRVPPEFGDPASETDHLPSLLETYPFHINPHEVDKLVSVPLELFLEKPESIYHVEWMGQIFPLRTYVYTDNKGEASSKFFITGLTAHIAHQVACLAYGVSTASPNDHHSISPSPEP